ncbi:MAG TPA: MMPL family transporter [Jiangellaceae bacterium]|nr:MMPL family transporter [Jiangellaceae bacterium]
MTSVLRALGRLVARHPYLTVLAWTILAVGCVIVALTGIAGPALFDRVETDEPTVGGSESETGQQILDQAQDEGEQVNILVRGVDMSDPDTASQVGAALEPTHEDLTTIDGVAEVISPFLIGLQEPSAEAMIAEGQDGFLLTVVLEADLGDDAAERAHAETVDHLESVPTEIDDADIDGATPDVLISSETLIADSFVSQVQEDLVTGEVVALPVALALMVIVFGGFLTAGMPLAGALVSIMSGLGALLGFTYVMDISSYMVNVITVVGLGLSIDYGLLVVSRYREELRAAMNDEHSLPPATHSTGRHAATRHRPGHDPVVTAAVVSTLASGGRTVAFSAVTIALAVSAMLLLRPDIMQALSASAVAVVLLAVLSAITLVPALMTIRGRRMLRPSLLSRVPGVRRLVNSLGDQAPETGFFSRVARTVHAHPWAVLLGVLAALGVFASPLANFDMRSSSVELLPAESEQRQFLTALGEQYPAQQAPTAQVVIDGTEEQVAALAEDIDGLGEVEQVEDPAPVGDYVSLTVHAATDDPSSDEAAAVVEDIRAIDSDASTWVTGGAASQKDFNDALVEGLPLVATVVCVAIFGLLFLMTGSVLVPLKALLTNALSLAASLGITVWVFIEGNFADLLDFEPVAGLESTLVPLILTFGFGLAMDYEVFLLTRIKEFWDAGFSNDEAVERGLQLMGRIITSAAAIIIAVFAGFAAGDLLAIKQVGVAMALVVLIDATLVRLLLVPATMTLLGKWNWWAPRPLRRLHQRFAISH